MPTQTIEQISKKYKLQMILFSLLIIAGIAIFVLANVGGEPSASGFYGTAAALILSSIGIGWLMIAKFLAWWHHG